MSEKIICQYCDNSYSKKVKYCPFCGAENVKEITETIPQCPRCNIEMEEESFRGSVIDICPKCSGIWLDGDEFRYHTSARDIYPDKKIPRNFRREPLSEERKYLPCVRCKKLMHRENFRRISSVLIDKCPAHGVWLDAGELEQIRSFIANGGLEDSQDKQIMENKEKISKVSRETKDLKLFARQMNKWKMRKILYGDF